jgi:Mg-chelatase subunit ChlD
VATWGFGPITAGGTGLKPVDQGGVLLIRCSDRMRLLRLVLLVFLATTLACRAAGERERRSERAGADDVPYQAEVEEGLGAAVAILIDTSGSMQERAPGDNRPKYEVAREALEAMLDATDGFIARRRDFPIKIGVYSFSSSVRRLLPIEPYDRATLRQALREVPPPGGGTAIGEAMAAARPDLYRAGVFRKYLLVVTDGENTRGRPPDRIAREIFAKSEGGVQVYFVAFDTNPGTFGFLKEVGGDVFGAGNGADLRKALDGVYQGKILAEAPGEAEREPVRK